MIAVEYAHCSTSVYSSIVVCCPSRVGPEKINENINNMLARGVYIGTARSCTSNAHTHLPCSVPQCGEKQPHLSRDIGRVYTVALLNSIEGCWLRGAILACY